MERLREKLKLLEMKKEKRNLAGKYKKTKGAAGGTSGAAERMKGLIEEKWFPWNAEKRSSTSSIFHMEYDVPWRSPRVCGVHRRQKLQEEKGRPISKAKCYATLTRFFSWDG